MDAIYRSERAALVLAAAAARATVPRRRWRRSPGDPAAFDAFLLDHERTFPTCVRPRKRTRRAG